MERGDKTVVPALKALAESASEPRTRLHALWTLDGIDELLPSTVIKALDDASRDVRVSALRLAERWLGETNQEVQVAVIKKIDDQNWAVREQLAATLGALPVGPRETAVAMLLERHADEPIVMDAAASGLRGRETAVIETLMRTAAETPMLATAMTVLSATAIRSGQETAIRSIFDWVADASQPEWQRSAILGGAEAALLGSALPGSQSARGRVAGNGAPAPCPTCAGARTGPGGAPAFPAAPAASAPPPAAGRGGGRGSGGPIVRLTTEPATLVALAAAGGDLSARAAKVLARVEWPGKPGGAAPVAPLTQDEQGWFNTGETVFKNLCQACHQADGRGQDKVAPSLVGSAFALGPPEIGARILLNGKEGKIGLMPPLGVALTDEQIAGALTYVRRQWGNTASAVDPALIRQVRALTATRGKPWTDEELSALLK